MKRFILAATFATLSTAATADIYECNRTRMSTDGFNSRSAAENWFPKTSKLQIVGDKAGSDYYGKGTVVEKDGRFIATFPIDFEGVVNSVSVTFIPRTNRYSVRLNTGGNYMQTVGAGGKCKKIG
ncbi:MAG: hypothetical protein AAGD04_07290 [Pseudomonadota bacterium]